MPHGGVPSGIIVYLTRECLQASAGVNGLKGLKLRYLPHSGS